MATESATTPVSLASRPGAKVLKPIFWFLAWFCLMVFPSNLPTLKLDSSWQSVLNFAAIHHLQYGVDIVFTYGPLGYLRQDQYCAGTWWQVMLFQALSRFVYLALVWSSVRESQAFCGGKKSEWLPFLFGAALLPAIDGESFYLLLITFAGACLLKPRKIDWLAFAVSALMALLALMKGTYLVFTLVVMGCVAIWRLMNARRLEAVLLPASFLLTFGFGWRVLGHQQFAHLPAWLGSVMEITSGYQRAMAVTPERNQLAGGVLVLLVLGAALLMNLSSSGKSFLTVLLMACGLFLAWKQGFIRSLEFETKIFFIFALTLAFALPVFLSRALPRIVLIFLLGLILGNSLLFRLPRPLYQGWQNLRFLMMLPRMAGTAAEQARAYALPEIQARVGGETVDVIGWAQAIALLNGLNYHPAPVFQAYAAYSASLSRRNADFYRSERAPRFLITSPDYRVDNRLPGLDESLSGLIIEQRYGPVLEENGYRLLQLEGNSHELSGPSQSGTFRVGESFGVNGGDWCQLVMEENLTGRLIRFAWASPPVYVDVWTNHASPTQYRFVPSMGESGFVVPAGTLELAISNSAAARWCFKPLLRYSICSTH